VIRASLDQSEISEYLSKLTSSKYWRVRVESEVGSTQDELKTELVGSGDGVVAEFQSAGRGRLDRKFESAPHVALLFSFYVEPQRSDAHGWVPLLAGMSVATTLNELTESEIFTNKWPNDVITESGKVCGVLCEKYGDGIIVGIGINVSTLPEELPVESASSIFIASGIEINRNRLLAHILENFYRLFMQWESGAPLKPRYRALCSTIGHEVSISLPNGTVVNDRAIDIGENGELFLESGSVVSVGDITHIRPSS